MAALTIRFTQVPHAFSRDDVAHAASGDVAAFERLYRAHLVRIHSLTMRMAGAAEADELTQDVFVRAWLKLSSFRGDSAFGTWLHRLAVNVVLERLRSRQSEQSIWVDDELAVERAEVGPAEVAAQLDLETALEELPPGARSVFVLHDIEGHTHHEIGELLSVTAGTSKAQLHRARMILRRHLQ